MKRVGKLCGTALCLLALLAGCSKAGESNLSPTGGAVETTVETAAETVEQGKEILSQNADDKVTFSFDYDPSEYLDMDADYRNIVFSADDFEVSEDAVQNQVDSLLLEHVSFEEVTDRGALNGDTLQMDFTGTIDGETIYDEQDFSLELGSGVMVPGFEDALEGAMAGDTITLDLEYPEDYGDELLNGKTVHFEVNVSHVYLSVIPDYTNEFVKEYTGYDTTEAYEASVKAILEDSAKSDAIAIWLDTHTTMDTCPDSLKTYCEQSMLEHLELYAEYTYGTSLENLLDDMNYDSMEDLLADPDNQDAVLSDARMILSYEYIVSKEGMESTVKDYVEYLETYAQEQGFKDASELLDYYSEEEMRVLYMKTLVQDFILEHAVLE